MIVNQIGWEVLKKSPILPIVDSDGVPSSSSPSILSFFSLDAWHSIGSYRQFKYERNANWTWLEKNLQKRTGPDRKLNYGFNMAITRTIQGTKEIFFSFSTASTIWFAHRLMDIKEIHLGISQCRKILNRYLEVGLMPMFKIIGVRTNHGKTVVQTMPFRPRSWSSISNTSIIPLTANFEGLTSGYIEWAGAYQ